MEKTPETVKILVVGNSGVGKTSLCNRYINDIFLKAHKPTVGVEFCSKEIQPAKSDRSFNLQFWDIGGQERYIYMTHVYYKSSDFCLIMFDLNNRESFKACARWKKDLDDKYRLEDGSKCPCLLIGNKCDLSIRILEQSEIEDFCAENEFYGYMEISVKKNIMVKETIDYITDIILMKKDLMLKAAKEASFLSSTATSSSTSTSYLSSTSSSLLKKDLNELPSTKKSKFSIKCNAYYNKLTAHNNNKEDNKKVGCLSMSKKTSCCNI